MFILLERYMLVAVFEPTFLFGLVIIDFNIRAYPLIFSIAIIACVI